VSGIWTILWGPFALLQHGVREEWRERAWRAFGLSFGDRSPFFNTVAEAGARARVAAIWTTYLRPLVSLKHGERGSSLVCEGLVVFGPGCTDSGAEQMGAARPDTRKVIRGVVCRASTCAGPGRGKAGVQESGNGPEARAGMMTESFLEQ